MHNMLGVNRSFSYDVRVKLSIPRYIIFIDCYGIPCVTFFFNFSMQSMWLGVMHHVCGEHEWSDGQCSHGPLTTLEDGKEYIQRDSKAAKALRDIIYDAQWINSLKFYVFFR